LLLLANDKDDVQLVLIALLLDGLKLDDPGRNIPLFPFLLKSFHAVLPLTYDLELAASKHSTKPSVTILGE
jgi:hypothetical protein